MYLPQSLKCYISIFNFHLHRHWLPQIYPLLKLAQTCAIHNSLFITMDMSVS